MKKISLVRNSLANHDLTAEKYLADSNPTHISSLPKYNPYHFWCSNLVH